MRLNRKGAAAAVAALSIGGAAITATALGSFTLTDAGSANTRTPGITLPDKISPQLREMTVAQGSNPLENPSAAIGYYGYYNNGPMLPAAGDLPTATHLVEATKSEPDKNTYLVVDGQHGADPAYNYGTHFLYQGHELSPASGSYITRINLDADAAHRVTKLAEFLADGTTPLPNIDGSTWDPFAQKLLFTTEGGGAGGTYQATLDYPSTVTPLLGILGQGGYEAIQNDDRGNLYIVEDVGGSVGTVNTHAKQPNSFVYRFLPYDATDLAAGGKLQVLQADSLAHAGPIVFHPGQADADILSQDTADLRTYGKTFTTHWLTIHDTAVTGTATAFSANALAKTAGGTPFKRPENGQFQPGTRFKTFFFDETGDTNNLSEAGAQHGAFGGVMKLQQSPTSDTGSLQLFYQADAAHAGFDNVAFYDRSHVIFVQDAGDTLHTQINALDSAFLFDTNATYAAGAQPVKIIAEGRDPSATIDSGFAGLPGYQNEGDNEITGIHISNGDPTAKGLLGASIPKPFRAGWRFFFTHQHGDNVTSEVIPTW